MGKIVSQMPDIQCSVIWHNYESDSLAWNNVGERAPETCKLKKLLIVNIVHDDRKKTYKKAHQLVMVCEMV